LFGAAGVVLGADGLGDELEEFGGLGGHGLTVVWAGV
jgi:hypothetical protein